MVRLDEFLPTLSLFKEKVVSIEIRVLIHMFLQTLLDCLAVRFLKMRLWSLVDIHLVASCLEESLKWLVFVFLC